jgi:hypothetical protein
VTRRPNPNIGSTDVVSDLPEGAWPAETDLVFNVGSSRLMLTIQRPLVRSIIQDAIENLRAALLFNNAFPDVCFALSLIKDCLFTAADLHKPAAKDILERLKRDLMNSDDGCDSRLLVTVRKGAMVSLRR